MGVGARSKPPEWLHHVAPSVTLFLPDIGAAEGGRGAAEDSWREVTVWGRIWVGGDVCVQNTRLPTAATETPFRLKLYIFLFKFCNIASSLILLSFHLLVLFFFRLFLIYIYIFLAFFFLLFSYFTK